MLVFMLASELDSGGGLRCVGTFVCVGTGALASIASNVSAMVTRAQSMTDTV